MMEIRSGTGSGLVAFLDWANEKGEMAEATARSFRAAVNSVLEVEGDPATIDVRQLDVDRLLDRFETRKAANYSTTSMHTYKSRFRRSVEMYTAYLAGDPNWKSPLRTRRAGSSADARQGTRSQRQKVSHDPRHPGGDGVVEDRKPDTVTYDLPLRRDLSLIAKLVLPVDLQMADAERIAQFVRSLAFDDSQTAPARRTGQETRQDEGD